MLRSEPTSLVFFLGKGGVGKTTLSLAYAIKLQEVRKESILVASLDPAHNLGNFLGVQLMREPKKVGANLYALEVDFEEALVESLRLQIERLRGLYKEFSVWNLEKNLEILRWVPGSEEQALLREIERIAREDWFGVIFDMPPTGLALRVIVLPRLMLFWLQRLESLREKILSLRETIASIKGKEGREDKVIEVLREQRKRYQNLIERLKDQERAHFFIISEPREVSLDEAKRILKTLEENEIRVKALLLNKFNKSDEGDREILSKVKEDFPVAVYSFPFVEGGGTKAFEKLAPMIPEEIL